MALDPQCQHIAGLCAAWLADHCITITTTTYRDPEVQARPGSPWLEVVRTAEQPPEWAGTRARLTRVATVEMTYRVTPQSAARREDAAGAVVAAVGHICIALDRARHAAYAGGLSLHALATITSITVDRIEYTHEPEAPSAVITVTVRHEVTPPDVASEELRTIIGDLNLDADDRKNVRRDEIAV